MALTCKFPVWHPVPGPFGWLSPPWVDSDFAQGRILPSPFFSTCLSTVQPPLVTLVASDPFRHVCQLYADDLVIFLHHRLTFRWLSTLWRSLAFFFWCRPHQVHHLVFGPVRGCPDCCVHLGAVPLLLVQQYMYFSLKPFLGALTSIAFVLAAIVSSTRPVLGALVKVSLSPYRLLSPMFSPARHLLSSSLVMTPALQQFNLAPSLVSPSSWVAQNFPHCSSALGTWCW